MEPRPHLNGTGSGDSFTRSAACPAVPALVGEKQPPKKPLRVQIQFVVAADLELTDAGKARETTLLPDLPLLQR